MELTPEMKIVIIAVLCLIGLVLYYYDQKRKRRERAIVLQDQIRQIANNLKKSAELLDSRIQWAFQDGDEYEPIKYAFNYFKELADKTDWDLAGFYQKHNDEWDEILKITQNWIEKKPDYSTKEEYLRDMSRIADIIKRW